MRTISDETFLLRMAIKEVLDAATEPMTSIEINDRTEVSTLGLSHDRVSRELKALHQVKRKEWPLKRIPASGPGRCAWMYFNPKVVKLAYAPKAEKAAPVNDVKLDTLPTLPEFMFNPVDFELAAGSVATTAVPVEAPAVNVPVPAGVKSITMTVAGVTIKIELGV